MDKDLVFLAESESVAFFSLAVVADDGVQIAQTAPFSHHVNVPFVFEAVVEPGAVLGWYLEYLKLIADHLQVSVLSAFRLVDPLETHQAPVATPLHQKHLRVSPLPNLLNRLEVFDADPGGLAIDGPLFFIGVDLKSEGKSQ